MKKSLKVVAAVAAGALGLAACASSGGSKHERWRRRQDAHHLHRPAAAGRSAPTRRRRRTTLIQLYLDQIGNKAGNYTIKFKTYDDSTAAKGAWDDATCAKNAQAHVANTNEVAVMGTYNSGLRQDRGAGPQPGPDGPMLMVSHANTNPGLTKTWDPGEPDKYYPTGTRNYARVVTTDDYQGAAAAAFAAKDLRSRSATSSTTTRPTVRVSRRPSSTRPEASASRSSATTPWDAKQTDYTALFEKIKATEPRLRLPRRHLRQQRWPAGQGQGRRPRRRTTGAVKLIAPGRLHRLPGLRQAARGRGHVPHLRRSDASTSWLRPAARRAKLLDDYKAKYGKPPASGYALYGVAAVQVILAAIEKSDGTRKSVTDAGASAAPGITIPADQSVIGKEIKIDPTTGDINAKDITIEIIKDGKETFLKASAGQLSRMSSGSGGPVAARAARPDCFAARSVQTRLGTAHSQPSSDRHACMATSLDPGRRRPRRAQRSGYGPRSIPSAG